MTPGSVALWALAAVAVVFAAVIIVLLLVGLTDYIRKTRRSNAATQDTNHLYSSREGKS